MQNTNLKTRSNNYLKNLPNDMLIKSMFSMHWKDYSAASRKDIVMPVSPVFKIKEFERECKLDRINDIKRLNVLKDKFVEIREAIKMVFKDDEDLKLALLNRLYENIDEYKTYREQVKAEEESRNFNYDVAKKMKYGKMTPDEIKEFDNWEFMMIIAGMLEKPIELDAWKYDVNNFKEISLKESMLTHMENSTN